jgi:hypothetical protein
MNVTRNDPIEAERRAMRLSEQIAFAAIGTILLGMTGCSDGTALNAHYTNSDEPADSLLVGNDLPVLVLGNPYNISQAELHKSVVSALQIRSDEVAVHFSDRLEDLSSPFRLTIVFAPPPPTGAAELYRNPAAIRPMTIAPGPQEVPFLASFCRNGRLLSQANGVIASGDGPTSERFRDGLGQVALAPFPGIDQTMISGE